MAKVQPTREQKKSSFRLLLLGLIYFAAFYWVFCSEHADIGPFPVNIGEFIKKGLTNLVSKIPIKSSEEIAKQRFISSLKVNQSIERGNSKTPLILFYTQFYDHVMWPDIVECTKCEITVNKSRINEADLVMFQGWKACEFSLSSPTGVKCYGWDKPDEEWNFPPRNVKDQVWFYYSVESQQNTASGERLEFVSGLFNYTQTYKMDSTLPFPYGRTIPKWHGDPEQPEHHYADKKSELLLWLVSHCGVRARRSYVEELKKFVKLDEFGLCSGISDGCDRGDKECIKTLKSKYKFYVAFENSNCEGYITEKFWLSLEDGVVPVVQGASMSYYERYAPHHSFIHVDNFTSPQELAKYLKYLDENDSEYNKYHDWRTTQSTQRFWVKDFCNVCTLARDKPEGTVNLSQFWNMDTECKKVENRDLIFEVRDYLNKPIKL